MSWARPRSRYEERVLQRYPNARFTRSTSWVRKTEAERCAWYLPHTVLGARDARLADRLRDIIARPSTMQGERQAAEATLARIVARGRVVPAHEAAYSVHEVARAYRSEILRPWDAQSARVADLRAHVFRLVRDGQTPHDVWVELENAA